MEYVYAALLLHESDQEINEENITAVLESAGIDVEESRVKALVAALEDVDIEDAVEQTAAVPSAGAPAAGGPAEPEEPGDEAAEEEAAAEGTEEADDEADEEEEDVSGEGLGDLFG